MEETISKVVLISVVLIALALVFVAFVRAQSQYQEAEIHENKIIANASRKTLALLYCFTNATSGNTMLHIYNYGSSNYTARLVVFHGNEILFNGSVEFPAKKMKVISLSPPAGNPSEYKLVIVWLESGELEVVRCLGE